jgi:hypothetical protein
MRPLSLPSILASAIFLAASLASPLAAQGIVVDEGTFSVTERGRQVGTEEFSIRRAGIGREDAFFANGLIVRGTSVDREEISPLLRATPPSGVAAGYQVRVQGAEALELQLTLLGNRYVAIARSSLGDEEREFPARNNTRVLDRDVAHHYYFIRDLREGEEIHVLEPRTRSQMNVAVLRRVTDQIQIEGRPTEARKLEIRVGQETRTIWYDRLGRVLRVEIPAVGYVAVRTDLVG